jgi:CTP:molybdopterin cytidylyltransferase MocA
MGVVAVLLAAGGGVRFAGPTHKLLAPFRGRRVVDWAYERAVAAGIGRVIVVTGALADLGLPDQVHNPRWADGMATSLQAGITAAGDADAVVVGLGDQPLVEPEAWRLVAAASAPIAVATYGGERGNPVRLDRSIWPLLPTKGDVGARKFAREREDLVVEVACPGNPSDVDTVEDLERWS